jgi:hypothetical protein
MQSRHILTISLPIVIRETTVRQIISNITDVATITQKGSHHLIDVHKPRPHITVIAIITQKGQHYNIQGLQIFEDVLKFQLLLKGGIATF